MAILKDSTVSSQGYLQLPAGTTAQRPSTPLVGMMRHNTTTGFTEYYDGSQWRSLTYGNTSVYFDGTTWQNVIYSTVPVFGTGAAGNVTTSGTLNSYAHLTANTTYASRTISVNSTSGFSVGQSVMIHQTQHSNIASAGNYEFLTIESISGTNITFTTNLVNRYDSTPSSANSNNQTSTITQIVGSPQYNNLTLNGLVQAKAWDGYSGGIVYLTCAGTLTCGSNWISAFGKGFRGGKGSTNSASQSQGYAGESIRGFTTLTNGTANDTGGGGAPGFTNSGGDSGASGGHAVVGDNGVDGSGTRPTGGAAIGDSFLRKIYFGGGGGRGGDNDDRPFNNFSNPDTGAEISGSSNWTSLFGAFTTYAPPWGTQRHSTNPDVSSGGGIVVIVAANVTDLKVTVRPIPGVGGSGSGEKSGAGAAGSILLKTSSGSTISSLDARGTVNATIDGDPTGGGSAGRIRVDLYGGSTLNGSGNAQAPNSNGNGAGTVYIANYE